MKNYNRDRRSKKRDYRSGGDHDRHQMYDAVCDECGKKCQVPFKPRGDKPIYCSDCFERQSGGRSGSSRRGDFRKRDYKEKKMYTAVCDECGKECEVPFRPTSGKPVYCSDCFKGSDRSNEGRNRAPRNDNLQEQIESLHTKLDSILHMLESFSTVKEEPKKKSSVKKVTPKKEKTETKKSVKKKVKKTTRKKEAKTRRKAKKPEASKKVSKKVKAKK